MIKIIKNGDLLNTDLVTIKAHQVNCQGVMGRGIASTIKDKYPNVFEEYKVICNKNKSRMLGSFTVHDIENNNKIINMYTQDRYGKTECYTDYEAFRNCVKSIIEYCEDIKCDRIGMPYLIGCGFAGGNWDIVYKILEEEFDNKKVELYLFDIDNKSR